MTDSSPILWFALSSIATGMLAAYAIGKKIASNYFHTDRHANLDGLRGFLALIMFICHAATWQQYLADGKWRVSDSPFLILPGQTGIVIFFMLTGFLFAGKYLDSKGKKIDWIGVYSSRVLRLYPAYLFAVFVVVIITVITGWLGQHPLTPLELLPYLQWMLFTIPGAPALNHAADTSIITAGVTWPLTYVWAYYCFLPILAPLMGTKASWQAIAISAMLLGAVLFFVPFHSLVYYMFALGVFVAVVDRRTRITQHLSGATAGVFALCLLVLNGWLHDTTSYTAPSITIIGIAFLIFASGNGVFGFLTTKTVQVLGLGTYSLYLMHGPLLYVTLQVTQHYFPGFFVDHATYWGIIGLVSSILVVISILCFVYIEAPTMKMAGGLSRKIKSFAMQQPLKTRQGQSG